MSEHTQHLANTSAGGSLQAPTTLGAVATLSAQHQTETAIPTTSREADHDALAGTQDGHELSDTGSGITSSESHQVGVDDDEGYHHQTPSGEEASLSSGRGYNDVSVAMTSDYGLSS
jgi:hypothetical protein